MLKTRTILISSETQERIIIRRRGKKRNEIYYCPLCTEKSEMIALDEAILISNFGTWQIITRILSEMVHSIEMDNGKLLICTQTLITLRQENERSINQGG